MTQKEKMTQKTRHTNNAQRAQIKRIKNCEKMTVNLRQIYGKFTQKWRKNDAKITITQKGRKNDTKSKNDAKHKAHKQCKTRTNQKDQKF